MTNLSAFAFEILSSSSTKALHLTYSLYAPSEGTATRAFITVEGEGRYTYHGEDPTSFEGHLVRDGGSIVLEGELQIKNFRCISTNTEPCRLSISYERP